MIAPLAALLLATTAATAAGGSDAEARAAQLFADGRAAFERGDAATAAQCFEAAFRVVPHASSLYNAGVAWETVHDSPRAADDYELALRLEQLKPEFRRDATDRLTALNRVLATLVVPQPTEGTLTVAHVERAPLPARVHLLPGKHVLLVTRADQSVAKLEVELLAGELRTVEVPEAAPALAQAPAAEARPAAVSQPPPPSTTTRWKPAAGWVGVALGAAAAVVAAVLGVQALGARDRYYASGFTDPVSRGQADTFRTLTNVGWGSAAVLVAAGIVLLVLAAREP